MLIIVVCNVLVALEIVLGNTNAVGSKQIVILSLYSILILIYSYYLPI